MFTNAYVSVADLIAIVYLFKKFCREKNGYETLARKSEQQMAELKALQERGMVIHQ